MHSGPVKERKAFLKTIQCCCWEKKKITAGTKKKSLIVNNDFLIKLQIELINFIINILFFF